MRSLLVIALVLCITCANAQSEAFTASILYSEPSMNGGALNGTMVYDWNYNNPSASYYMDFSEQVYSVLFQYNYNRGFTNQVAQWTYRYGPGCPGGCETGAISDEMPKFFIDSTYTASTTTQVLNGQTCTKNTPTTADPLNPLSELWVTSLKAPCLAVFTNGNRIVFTSITNSVPTEASVFTPKMNCSCGKPIDVSIVLDRSGSISVTEFKEEVAFLNQFIAAFKIGPDQTQIALSSFNTKTTQILALTNSQTTVVNAINAMTCISGATGDQTCQNGGTSISAGLQMGADLLSPAASGYRADATHVIIVITDGIHNTLADSGATYCYGPCTDSNGNIGSYTNCGDKNNNYIPDDWEAATKYACPTVCNNFTCTNPTASCTKWSGMSQCHRDLINAREYAFNQVGDSLIVFAIGVGPEVSIHDLYMITDNQYKIAASSSTLKCSNVRTRTAVCINTNYVPCGGTVTAGCFAGDLQNPQLVIVNQTWANLNAILLQLSSLVCDSNAQPCGTCCGYCKCGVCSPPDSCPSSNYCDEPFLSGACCSIKNRTCTPRNVCETAACSRTANSGAGGCVYTPVPCPPTDACYSYACNLAKTPATCDPTLLASPPTDLCHISACTNGVLINNQPKVCTPASPDVCQNYGCNVTTGICYSTPKPLPTAPSCFTVSCNSSSTNASYPFVFTPVPCPTADPCQPNTCNVATGSCQTKAIVCNNASNLCDKSACVGGVCQPSFTNCPAANCKVNCACVTTTGACQCSDKLCPNPGCIPQTCDVTSGICVNTSTTCPTGCANNTCSTRNNQCFTFACILPSDPSQLNNCNGVTAAPACTNNGDQCLTNCTCVNATGCVCSPVVCPVAAPCYDLVRNSSLPAIGAASACCQYNPRVCPQDACNTGNCTIATDSCALYPNCPAGDKCTSRGCNMTNGNCYSANIPCVAPDACTVIVKCDPILGCSFAPKDCNDNINCTTDTCNITTGACVNTPIVCNDNDPCTDDSCDNTTGLCSFPAHVCDDNNVCTTDSCNSAASDPMNPCVFTPIDVANLCNDNNRCTNDTCDPVLSCQNTPYEVYSFCGTPADACSIPICIDTYGCTTRARTCAINSSSGLPIEATDYVDLCDGYGNATNSSANATVKAFCAIFKKANATDCSYAVCTVDPMMNTTYNCTLESNVCAALISSTVVIAATLSAAVIVGIVIAVVAAAGACGGASYAAYNKLGGDADAATHTSPLYVPNTKGGDNALYNPDQ